jgi:16S rRNA (guanine966-N2)-methyltransferase
MRIIGGSLKGRRFSPPASNWPTRPTTDFSKESLYNILDNRVDFDEMIMLDLFGGTGSHCYECISRGCIDVTYVELFAPAIKYVKETAQLLKIEDSLTIVKADVVKWLPMAHKKFTYIFADPPYEWDKVAQLPDMIFGADILLDEGIFVYEHEKKHKFHHHPHFVEERKYGATILSFFENN